MNTEDKIPGGKGGWIMPRKKGDPAPEGAGRPKGSRNTKTRLAELLSVELTIKDPISNEDQTAQAWDHILISQIRKAIMGHDTAAANFLLDRLEGKPVQYVGADPETQESQKQFDNMSVDELRDIVKGKEVKGDDNIEFEEIRE